MKNFMIGQYGGFDQAKYARDFIASTGMFGVFMIRETMFGSKSTQKQSFNHVVSRCLRG
ncbi:hypothetical protein [Brevibacillus brevis]|uniref:hypothetical protein n=1 Tax=Brevibacillus brevis TaxID=1393 RepID=UPI001EE36164|nr:hypothetical protein [Brevibacillus brevis]